MSVAVPPPVAAIFRVLLFRTPGTFACGPVSRRPPDRSAVRAPALLLDSVGSLCVAGVQRDLAAVDRRGRRRAGRDHRSSPAGRSTSLLTLISFGSLPVAVAATKVSVLPLTVSVSPTVSKPVRQRSSRAVACAELGGAGQSAGRSRRHRCTSAGVGSRTGEAERGAARRQCCAGGEVGGRTGLQGVMMPCRSPPRRWPVVTLPDKVSIAATDRSSEVPTPIV